MSTGSSYYDNVRPLAYPDSDAVLICFDISRPETLDSVIKKVSVCFFSFCSPLFHLFGSAFNICSDAAERSGVGQKKKKKKDISVLAAQHLRSWRTPCASSLHFHGSTIEQISSEVKASHSFFPHQKVHGYLTRVPPRNGRSEQRMGGEAQQPGGSPRRIRYAN